MGFWKTKSYTYVYIKIVKIYQYIHLIDSKKNNRNKVKDYLSEIDSFPWLARNLAGFEAYQVKYDRISKQVLVT